MAKTKKVPKRIAGVKLSKTLRRDLRALARTPSGRTALIEALTAATAAHAPPVQAQPGSPPRKVATKSPPKAKAAAKQPDGEATAAATPPPSTSTTH
jgi:hypothetical protein